jgi:hypothetical protein
VLNFSSSSFLPFHRFPCCSTNGTVIKTNNGIFYPDVAPNDADRFMTYAGAQVSETTMRLFRFNESTAPSYNTTDRFSESGALTMSYYRAERLGDDELARRTCGEEGGKESDTEEKEVSMCVPFPHPSLDPSSQSY